jgi:hypothetical protein
MPKWRAIRRRHPFPVIRLGETLFVRGETIIAAVEAAGEEVTLTKEPE